MLKNLRTIEGAIRNLYSIDTPHRAEDFLMEKPHRLTPAVDGVLCVRPGSALEVGIYFSPEIRESLSTLSIQQGAVAWSSAALNSFSVAVEEVSHFHCLLFHATRGRPVSQLELEIQGEIDRFLLCLFSNEKPELAFDVIIERLFEGFSLRTHLTPEEVTRYRDANNLARNFVLKHMRRLTALDKRERLFRFLRRYYRLAADDKLTLADTK